MRLPLHMQLPGTAMLCLAASIVRGIAHSQVQRCVCRQRVTGLPQGLLGAGCMQARLS